MRMDFSKLKSRKFLVTIISAVLYGVNLVVLDNPYTPEQIMPAVAMIITWVVAQGWVDGKEAGKVETTAVRITGNESEGSAKIENCVFETK